MDNGRTSGIGQTSGTTKEASMGTWTATGAWEPKQESLAQSATAVKTQMNTIPISHWSLTTIKKCQAILQEYSAVRTSTTIDSNDVIVNSAWLSLDGYNSPPTLSSCPYGTSSTRLQGGRWSGIEPNLNGKGFHDPYKSIMHTWLSAFVHQQTRQVYRAQYFLATNWSSEILCIGQLRFRQW